MLTQLERRGQALRQGPLQKDPLILCNILQDIKDIKDSITSWQETSCCSKPWDWGWLQKISRWLA